MDKSRTFTTEQIYTSLLHRVSQIINIDRKDKYKPITCCVSVPSYYSVEQRSILLDLCKIIELQCQYIVPECTATALGYGLTNLARLNSAEKETILLFVDMGVIAASATVVKYTKVFFFYI